MSPAQLNKLGATSRPTPICVGPFMYESRVAGDSITVIKSPFYYDKKNVHLDKIVFKVENDTAAAAAALKAGDLQALDGIDSTQLQGIKSRQEPRRSSSRRRSATRASRSTSATRTGSASCRTRTSARRSRRAPSCARRSRWRSTASTMNKVVFGGTVLPGCTPISPSSAWYDPSVKCTRVQPDATRRSSSQQSGVSNPTVHLMVPTATAALRQAQFMQAEEAAVGINVVIESTDFVTSLSKADAGNVRHLPDRLVGSRRPGRQHLPVRRDDRLAERQRLLEPAARPAPEQRAQGVDDQDRAEDAVPRRPADHPRRPAADLPLPPGDPRRRLRRS